MHPIIDRRGFLATAAAVSVGLAWSAEPADKPLLFKLGLVTYNVAAQWDLPTILKICKDVGVAAVECRTTHKHGVEPTLNAAERQEVKKRFADSGVDIWGCGSVCEFHSPDPAVVKKNIEKCKQFVELVKDMRRQGRQGAAQRPAQGSAGREDAGADRQIADRMRQGGGRRRRRNLGRGARRLARRCRPTSRRSWSIAAIKRSA